MLLLLHVSLCSSVTSLPVIGRVYTSGEVQFAVVCFLDIMLVYPWPEVHVGGASICCAHLVNGMLAYSFVNDEGLSNRYRASQEQRLCAPWFMDAKVLIYNLG